MLNSIKNMSIIDKVHLRPGWRAGNVHYKLELSGTCSLIYWVTEVAGVLDSCYVNGKCTKWHCQLIVTNHDYLKLMILLVNCTRIIGPTCSM